MTVFVRGTLPRTRAHVEPLAQVAIQLLAGEVPLELEEPLGIQQEASSRVVAQHAVVQAAASSLGAQLAELEEALQVAVRSEQLLHRNSRQGRLENQ